MAMGDMFQSFLKLEMFVDEGLTLGVFDLHSGMIHMAKWFTWFIGLLKL